METIKAFFEELFRIIKTYDLQTVLKLIHDIDWLALLKNPVSWVVILLIAIFVVLTKRYRYVILFLSIVAFAYMTGKVLPSQVEEIELKHLVSFFGATAVLVGINFYFFVIRE